MEKEKKKQEFQWAYADYVSKCLTIFQKSFPLATPPNNSIGQNRPSDVEKASTTSQFGVCQESQSKNLPSLNFYFVICSRKASAHGVEEHRRAVWGQDRESIPTIFPKKKKESKLHCAPEL